ncbi:MAG TPA: TRAP transporter small permease [Methanocellales archaeon]|nr:TRAP transporter small permease [Methanocellales archaeon]
MKRIIGLLVRIIDGLTSFTGRIAALCIMASALIIMKGVVARQVFNLSGIWEIELSVFLLLFSCFVGAAFVQKQGSHLNVDLFIIYLRPKHREAVLIILSIFSCILCGVFAWFSWPMWWQTVVENHHSESYWGPPLWIPYFFLPFGMSLFFCQYIIYIAKKINAVKREIIESRRKES